MQKEFSAKPKVAFAGFGNAGKSSLLNAIYGAEVARVSMQTDDHRPPKWPSDSASISPTRPAWAPANFRSTICSSRSLSGQHIVIHVLNGASAVSAEDEKLHRIARGASARSLTVINKVDLLDERERREFVESATARLGLR